MAARAFEPINPTTVDSLPNPGVPFTVTVTVKREDAQPHTASPPITNITPLKLSPLLQLISPTHITIRALAARFQMSTPLVDIDANPRQPGFKPTRMGSKIPSAPKFQRTGSTGRHSSFSVNTTGSPGYVAMPAYIKPAVSPTPTSKIPRKSTPAHSAFSKSYTYGSRPATPHTSLPRPQNWHSLAAVVVPHSSDSIRTTPPLSCDKPLPSPPVAQLMNPASPPKAQRTLVDAESGTPPEEVWPVLQPENIPPSRPHVLSSNDQLPQRSVLGGPALRYNGLLVPESCVDIPSVNNRTSSQMSKLSIEDKPPSHQRPVYVKEPHIVFKHTNPYAKSFHALSPEANVAIDSPLASKQQDLQAIAIPPRTSSKRTSLPSSDTTAADFSAKLSSPIHSARSGVNKWPTSNATDEASKAQVTDEERENDQYVPSEPKNDECPSFDGLNITQSHYGSIDSVSTWSLAADLSLDDAAVVNYGGAVRIKRFSCHSSSPDSGPTLRIAADADEVLLGRGSSSPAMPGLLEHTLRLPERPTGIFPGRVSKQALVSTDVSVVSRTSTSSSTTTETEMIGSRSIKIMPIRSMQPPRIPSIGDLSQQSPSLEAVASTDVDMIEQSLNRTRVNTTVTQPESNVPLPTSQDHTRNNHEAGNYSTILQGGLLQNATQVMGMDTETPQSATRKLMPITWITPKSAAFALKKSAATCSKTSPLLRSSERVNNRMSAISTRSHSNAASSLALSAPFQAGNCQASTSRLGVVESVAENLDSIFCDKPSKEIRINKQAAEDKTLKRRAKRSFRDIFGKRDTKRSSVARSTLAQRIRCSANFSKTSLARPSTAKTESREDPVVFIKQAEALGAEQDRQTLLSARRSTLETVLTSIESAPPTQYDTANVIQNIIRCVTSMKENSPECLRGLEIAEAVLHAIECSKEARLSAELARKQARDAELYAEGAGIELSRLEKLCEPGFDDEVMRAIRQLILSAVIVKSNDEA